MNKHKGFTIVELLIVIVVIAILAAISVVAYSGIQSRSKTASAFASASNAAKKAEIYYTIIGNYPTAFSNLTSAPSEVAYRLDGVPNGGTLTNDTNPVAVTYYVCATGSPSGPAAINTTNVSGARIYYRDYVGLTNKSVNIGEYSGTGISCFGIP